MEKHFCPYGHDCPFNDDGSLSSGTYDDMKTGRPNGQVGTTIGMRTTGITRSEMTSGENAACTVNGETISIGSTYGEGDSENYMTGGDRHLGNSVGKMWDWNGKEIKTSGESFGWCGRNGTLSHGATTGGTSYNGTRSNSFSSSDNNKDVTSTSDGMSKVKSTKSDS